MNSLFYDIYDIMGVSREVAGFLFAYKCPSICVNLPSLDKIGKAQVGGLLLGAKMNNIDANIINDIEIDWETLCIDPDEYQVVCGLCRVKFWTDEYGRLICYSQKCMDEYDNAAKEIRKERKLPVTPVTKKIIHPDKQPEIKPQPEITLEKSRKYGYVYLLSAENGLYKIGRSKNVESRRNEIERNIPIKITILHYFASNQYIKAERFLHARFHSRRVKYEWFKLTDAEVDHIRKLKDLELDNQLV